MNTRLGILWLIVLAGGGLGGCTANDLWIPPQASAWQTTQFPAPSWNPPSLAAPTLDRHRAVLAQPPTDAYRSRTAGLLLFRLPPHLPEVSHPLTQVFYQSLLKRRPFREIIVIPRTYGTLEEALEIARAWRLDLLLVGEAPYFLDGGTVGAAALQVDLKVLETETGRLLWYLSEAMRATPRPIVDLMVTETRPYPTPRVYELAAALADRMCQTLQNGSLSDHR
jgi:hypothetical protein